MSTDRSGTRAALPGWRRCCLSVAAALVLAGCAAQTAFTEGQELLAAEQVDAGLARIQEAIKLEPGSAEYRIAYARAQERYVKASLEAGERALADASYEAADLAFRRALVLQAGNERALTGLQLVAAARRHDLLYSEALAAWSRADGEAALASLRKILVANPQHSRALDLQRVIDSSAARVVKESALAVAYRKPISIEFKDTPLKTVFEVISRTSGLNFVFDKDLRADQKVTIFLRNSTIEAAINLVLLTNQLEQRVLDGNSILIYPNTPLKQRDYQALTVRTFYLANSDAKTVATTLKTILKSRDIVVDEKLNLLMIRDSPEAVRVAEKLVALQDVPEPEVMLEVEILEVKRSRLRDLGVNWPNTLALTPLPSVEGGQLTLNDLRNLNSSTIGATVSPVLIRANQLDSDVNLLANPRIRARNREKAKILIGERVPNITSTATSTGFVSESITYIDVGLKLDIEPTIYLDNEVAIKVTLEVSNIVDQVETKSGTVAYRIGTRTATSVLRLKDGENQLLAGLISDEDRRTADKVPFLGDIPVLGRLFGGHREEGIKTEIVLSITPRVLRNIQRPEAYLAEFDGGTESNFRSRPAARGAAVAGASGPVARSGWPLSPVGLSTAASGAQPAATANSAGIQTAPDAQTAQGAQTAEIAPAAVASAAGAQLLWQGPTQLGTGDSFALQLLMQADQPVVSLPLAIAFDPRVVQVANVSEGGFLRQNGGETSFTYRVDPGGQVLITGTRSGAGGATLQDVVATLNFRAVAPGEAKIELITIAPVGSGGSAIKAKLPPAHPLTVVQ